MDIEKFKAKYGDFASYEPRPMQRNRMNYGMQRVSGNSPNDQEANEIISSFLIVIGWAVLVVLALLLYSTT